VKQGLHGARALWVRTPERVTADVLDAGNGEEIGRLVALEWWRECSRVVALTRSFIDYLSAEIAKQHGTVRTGNDSGEIDNANAFERPHDSPHESVAANSAKSATIMSG
jgi:hypothetical protein